MGDREHRLRAVTLLEVIAALAFAGCVALAVLGAVRPALASAASAATLAGIAQLAAWQAQR